MHVRGDICEIYMRRRHRSGGRIMLRGKPALVVLALLLLVGTLVAYYSWNRGSSVTSNARFEKYRQVSGFKQRNMGKKYKPQDGPQMQDPPNFENRMFKGKNKFGGVHQMPLEPKQFGSQEELERGLNDDYKFREDADDRDGRDFYKDKDVKEDPRKDFKIKEDVKEDPRSNFQDFSEKKTGGILYPQLYVKPDAVLIERFRKMEHIVHIDLKGAPPKIDYLIRLFPLMSKLGATGLLLEYEDMFPYNNELQILAANNAYNRDDIRRLLEAAKVNKLKVIPLVQTFGHMEFVLKYPKYQHLRESTDTPQVITPVMLGSYELINKIIDQVMSLHPDSPYVHIGCDEVYELGKGLSGEYMKQHNFTKYQLFLQHVKKVAEFVPTKFPKTKVIMWDDELRHMPDRLIEQSGLGSKVELMVWSYTPHPSQRFPKDMWAKYSKHFPGVWAASSFKGATGSAQFFTNVSYHLENHINWIQLVKQIKDILPLEKFRGFAMTGWQRYDHFATLCELLPSSIPSMAVNLMAIQNGGFTADIHNVTSKMLNCSQLIELDFPKKVNNSYIISQDCKFPGSMFYYAVQQLWGDMDKYHSDAGLQSRIEGWMTNYHVKNQFSNPGQMKVLKKKLGKILEKLKKLEVPVRDSLKSVFDAETIEEWVQVHLNQRINDLQDKYNKADMLLQKKVWNKRPPAAGTSLKPMMRDFSHAYREQQRQQQQQQQQQQQGQRFANDVAYRQGQSKVNSQLGNQNGYQRQSQDKRILNMQYNVGNQLSFNARNGLLNNPSGAQQTFGQRSQGSNLNNPLGNTNQNQKPFGQNAFRQNNLPQNVGIDGKRQFNNGDKFDKTRILIGNNTFQQYKAQNGGDPKGPPDGFPGKDKPLGNIYLQRAKGFQNGGSDPLKRGDEVRGQQQFEKKDNQMNGLRKEGLDDAKRKDALGGSKSVQGENKLFDNKKTLFREVKVEKQFGDVNKRSVNGKGVDYNDGEEEEVQKELRRGWKSK
ncbi:uncharacterized protein LOC124258300 isoform X2 [Haliotis rubra]|uniref:uncharacterized protein LOC124258300 isoform X2 n=1 Tax=Haliotis rubra TaxID=36100 RepID=UPI001EE5C672|nr:uncharacterized protein LOC124258300 isoform X2 [Haliotis rubra]